MPHNIFEILSKYKKQEDYWTAALVHLLENLWGKRDGTKSRKVCSELLSCICGEPFDTSEKVTFETQRFYKSEEADAGSRLDLEITTRTKRIWIEVKDRSSLRPGQIDKYLSELTDSKYPEKVKKLVLLRLLYGDWKEAKKAHSRAYWFEIYDWLEKLKKQAGLDDNTIQGNMVKQFLGFLELKGVRIMSKLDKEAFENGLSQIISLIAMLKQVVQEMQFRVLDNKSSEYGSDWFMGFCFELNLKDNQGDRDFIGYRLRQGKYNVGIDPNDSENLYMGMRIKDIILKDERIIQEKLEDGDLYKDDGWIWCHSSLTNVLNKPTKDKQIEQLGILFKRMFKRLMEVQRLRPGKP
ncbi:MAG: PD-(D/E)XK nuclease family protein [Chloroflexota bacterium]|nr:PD-(D/E)XK nuclease family protein [Chloroflexota bacterium]